MWNKEVRKTVFTLNIDNTYSKELTDLTYPFIKGYAHKIGANFHVINERKFPDFPIVYEKLQIYELAQEMNNDWNIYFDCDALIHPDLMDVTLHVPFDAVSHMGFDIASFRWKYDRFFKRDGRFIGSCNWFSVASSWCIELWKPIDDMTIDEISENIFPIKSEIVAGIKPIRLIDDYVLSRNIAKYGLKFKSFHTILKELGQDGSELFYHRYAMPPEQKVVLIKQQMKKWGLL